MKNNYSNVLLFFLFSIFIAFVFVNDFKKETLVSFLFLCIIYQSLFIIFFIGENTFNLLKVFFIFQLLFMGLIPFSEYNNNIIYWTRLPFREDSYVLLNCIILLLNIVFVATYNLFKNIFKKNITANEYLVINRVHHSLKSKFIIYVILFLSVFTTLYLNDFSILSVLVRAGEFKEVAEVSSSTRLILNNLSKFIPFFCFMYLISVERKVSLTLFFAFICLVFCAFPFGIPRFMVAAIYLPILFRLFPKLLQGLKGTVGLVFSILFIFPFLEQFRNFNHNISIRLIPELSFFTQGHFDSYQSFLRVLDENIITYGQQLLGVFFFFIPRVVWESKPVGSGYHMAGELGYSFKNISMNYFGEGYINFGLFGVLLFVVFMAIICAYLDLKFRTISSFNDNEYNSSVYLFSLGYITFLLRGDLLSSFAFLISALLSYFVIKFLFIGRKFVL